MAKIQLKEYSQRTAVEFDPIEISGGIKVNFSKSENGDKKEYRGRAIKDEREIGSASYTTASNRIFLNVHPVNEIGEGIAKEVADTLISGILSMFNK